MAPRLLLRQAHVIEGPDRASRRADVEIVAGRIASITPPAPSASETSGGDGPIRPGEDDPPQALDAHHLWLAPALVDPHSVLEDPVRGRAETLASLRRAAAAGGYGTVALLPWAVGWRDRPERLDLGWEEPMRLALWGAFSDGGEDRDLAPHADQIEAGAVGIATGDRIPPIDLLERALLLREWGNRPVLIPPRQACLSHEGFVRERVEALRAGWPLDPPISETLPLQALLTLDSTLSGLQLRLMNLSSLEGVACLRRSSDPPQASVCWWHLVADSGSLDPTEEGWRLLPALGGPSDREALIDALAEDLITAVAVHHLPLDAEERLLPLDQRRAGVAGHGLVLTLLWKELVDHRGWPPERLWRALCWGPSRFLGLPAETLETGSRRWLLFDPRHRWRWGPGSCPSQAANQPCWDRWMEGAVVASGFTDPAGWALTDDRWNAGERISRRPVR